MNDYIYEFKDLPSTDTPYNAKTFTAMQNKLLDSIYPIGSIMIKDDATDYSSYLGFEWEKVFAGVTLVGLDTKQTEFNTIGKTGGEKTHQLTVAELPEFKPTALVDTQTGSVTGSAIVYQAVTDGIWYSSDMFQPIGGNQPHNNLQPYQVVAYWKRVA